MEINRILSLQIEKNLCMLCTVVSINNRCVLNYVELTYLTAVGYSSTVAAFTTLPPMPAHMSAINAYTCISGLSVSMQIIPPKPLPTKTTTVA